MTGMTEDQNLKAGWGKTGNYTAFYNCSNRRCSWSLKIECTLRCIYLTALFFFFCYATVHSVSQKQWNSIWSLFLFLITLEGLFCVSASSWLNSVMITKSLWKVSHWRLSKIFYCSISKLNFEIAIPGKTLFLKLQLRRLAKYLCILCTV